MKWRKSKCDWCSATNPKKAQFCGQCGKPIKLKDYVAECDICERDKWMGARNIFGKRRKKLSYPTEHEPRYVCDDCLPIQIARSPKNEG